MGEKGNSNINGGAKTIERTIIGVLILGIWGFTFNQGLSTSNRIAAIDTKIAVFDEKIEDLDEKITALATTNEELKETINELTIGLNSCKDVKRKLRRTLNE